MKILFTLILVTILGYACYSQTKILFDATKAETAGNADWIIDADIWNLNYNPNPTTGGNEANAQQYPTPNQSGITSTTNEDYWTGAISAWAVDAVKLGYYVETLPYNGEITFENSSNPQDLSNYNIFVVCEPNILFTSAEKTAIMNFVQSGGGLFMISDHNNSDRNGDGYDSPHIWNDFMNNNSVQNNPFGISFDYQDFSENTNNIPNLPNDPLLHGTYGNVTSVEFSDGTSMTLYPSQNPSVKGVVYKNGVSNTGNTSVMCAYATFGNGKVVALGDSSPADDGSGDPSDNLYDGWIQDANGNHERLIMNATIWLASNSTNAINDLYKNEILKYYSKDKTCFFTLETNNKVLYSIDIYGIMGRMIESKNNLASGIQNQVKLPKKGIYLYKVSTENGEIETGKICL